MKLLFYPENRQEIEGIILKRSFSLKDQRSSVVEEIILEVKEDGDKALYKYTAQLDRANLQGLKVSEEEIEEAYQGVEQGFIFSLKKAIENVADYHQRQLRQSWFNYRNGGMTGQLINPLSRVGAYVPGGRAAYPSSVVMTVIPARVAGVDEVVVTTPPDSSGKINPYTLVAAKEAGVDEIYKVGGAQAIAALAFGTESIEPVDKIVGPGNIYVTLAKKMVYGIVDIDMLAGPSEVLILADGTARPDYIAADLLSQAEHDPLAIPVLITTEQGLIDEVKKEIESQLQELIKQAIARRAVEDNGLIVKVTSLDEGIELVNRFAPEHFELIVKEPFRYLDRIKNAGAIFIGEYSSEPLGDYLAGPNHVLPTGGTARYASPLNTDDFIKKSSIIYYSKEELFQVKDDIVKLATLEGLDAHAEAVRIRFRETQG
jgi:histidinol dehydrogenase